MDHFGHVTLSNAKVQAFRHPVLHFVGGVVFDDPERADTRPLRHTRYWVPCDSFTGNIEYNNRLSGRFIYAGPVYNHFGHFMSEMVHRILLGKTLDPGGTLLFVNALNEPVAFDGLPPFIRRILQFFGLSGSDIQVICEDTLVDELLVAEAGSDFGGGPKPGYTDVLANFTPSRIAELVPGAPDHRNIYVSRSRIKHGGSFLGERYIESWLESAGFCILHPEELPFEQQVGRYAGAKNVVFSEGSACHGTEVLGTAAMGGCILIGRRPSHQEIFSRVLKPRSQSFRNVVAGVDLGTAVARAGSGAPLAEYSVSLVNPPILVDVLKDAGLAPNIAFDVGLYLEEAERDLEAYLAYHDTRPSRLFEPLRSHALLERFADARQMALGG